jgi:hypothetical protein
MIEGAKDIIAQLNSPSDWAVVGGAAVLGFVVDGAINIIPLPFFSPGVCGISAAGIMLSTKRGAEALSNRRAVEERRRILLKEAARCGEELDLRGETAAVEELSWRLKLDGSNTELLESIVREARESLRVIPALSPPKGTVSQMLRGGLFSRDRGI